jgi:hypothetical protein
MSFTLVDESLRINMSRFAREILTGFVCRFAWRVAAST